MGLGLPGSDTGREEAALGRSGGRTLHMEHAWCRGFAWLRGIRKRELRA